MKKNDLRLFFIILVGSLSVLIFFQIFNRSDHLKAEVYVQNEKVYQIELETIEEKYSKVFPGKNGDVEIEFSQEGVRVIREKSPLNICSRQGIIKSSGAALICLPNDIYVKLIKVKSNEVVIG